MNVILASASPRRKELLKHIYPLFSVLPADVDETVPALMDAEDVSEYLAKKKALHLAKSHEKDLIIAADTTVLLNGQILGKPLNEEEAIKMLTLLSDQTHKVVTGCCLALEGKIHSFSQTSLVTFYPLCEEEILQYVASGDPLDKAGAYGIQTGGCLFVKEIQGDYFNIVGLPVSRLHKEIQHFLKK